MQQEYRKVITLRVQERNGNPSVLGIFQIGCLWTQVVQRRKEFSTRIALKIAYYSHYLSAVKSLCQKTHNATGTLLQSNIFLPTVSANQKFAFSPKILFNQL